MQGSLVVAKTATPDFGISIGYGAGQSEEDKMLTNSQRKGYALHSLYFNFREKVYRNIIKNVFAGAGILFDIF